MSDDRSLPAEFPGSEKIRIILDRVKLDMAHYLSLGGHIHMPLTLRVSPTISPQARREVEAKLGAAPYRPHNEHSYHVKSGALSVAALKQLLAMDDVIEVNYAGVLKEPSRGKPGRLR